MKNIKEMDKFELAELLITEFGNDESLVQLIRVMTDNDMKYYYFAIHKAIADEKKLTKPHLV